MKRAALVIALSAVILVAVISVRLRIEQHRFRRQAEQLLSDVRELELKKSSATEVRLVVRKWGFEEWSRPDKPCTEDDCIYHFRFMAGSLRIHRFADPFIKGARIFDWLGLRPSIVQSWIQIRGKALRSVSFSVDTLGRGCDGSGCTLMGYVGTKQGEDSWSAHDQPDVNLEHTLLHPNFVVGTFPALLNVDTGGSPAVIVWAEFSSGANAADVSRLMQFDLSCLTRLRSCKNRDLMPTVWAQSVDDSRESRKSLTCTPEVERRVAQLADVIVLLRPQTVVLRQPRGEGWPSELPNLEVVSVIKKPKHPRQLGRLDVGVEGPEMTTADTRSPIQARQQYLFSFAGSLPRGERLECALPMRHTDAQRLQPRDGARGSC